jgi:hypothetical protein
MSLGAPRLADVRSSTHSDRSMSGCPTRRSPRIFNWAKLRESRDRGFAKRPACCRAHDESARMRSPFAQKAPLIRVGRDSGGKPPVTLPPAAQSGASSNANAARRQSSGREHWAEVQLAQLEVPEAELTAARRHAGLLRSRYGGRVQRSDRTRPARCSRRSELPRMCLQRDDSSSRSELEAGWSWAKLRTACAESGAFRREVRPRPRSARVPRDRARSTSHPCCDTGAACRCTGVDIRDRVMNRACARSGVDARHRQVSRGWGTSARAAIIRELRASSSRPGSGTRWVAGMYLGCGCITAVEAFVDVSWQERWHRLPC